MKKTFVLTIILLFSCISLTNAQSVPLSVECIGFEGKRCEKLEDKIEWTDDRIISSITYIFSKKDNKIFDTQGGEYILIKNGNRMVGLGVYPAADNLITFLTDENLVIITRHASSTFALPTSCWTMVAKCKFNY